MASYQFLLAITLVILVFVTASEGQNSGQSRNRKKRSVPTLEKIKTIVNRHLDSEPLEKLRRVKRVIGGSDIEVGQWPYLVHLTGKIPSKVIDIWGWIIPLSYKLVYCGGAVVDKKWVMTAAHCLSTNDGRIKSRIQIPKYWHAKVGEISSSHTVFDNIKDLAGRAFNRADWRLWNIHASKIIIHPQYKKRDDWKNDIALFKLEKDLPVGDSDPNVAVVELPSGNTTGWPAVGDLCIIKGWGCTRNGGSTTKVAKAVVLPMVSEAACSVFYGNLTNTRMCAGYNLKQKGICSGDSGAPLVCKMNGKWTQAGIASFTSATRPGQVPGVFTRVTHYLEWILDVIRIL